MYRRQQNEYRYHVKDGRRSPTSDLNHGFPDFNPAFPGDSGSVQVGLRPDDDGECPVLAHHPHLEVILGLQELVHVAGAVDL